MIKASAALASRIPGIYSRVAEAAWHYAEQIIATRNSDMTPHGHFNWNELRTRNADAAMKFYSETIGWTFEPIKTTGGPSYWVAYMNGQPVGGLFPLTDPRFDGVPESWMSFLSVDDVDARVKKAVAAGAKLVMPIFDVPDVGRIAMLLEPSGAGIGWITPIR